MHVFRVLKTKALSVIGLACLATALQAAEPVRIGYSMSLTGIFAQAAPSQVNAYELWKEQVNAKGGIDVAGVKRIVEFVTYDDQSNPANAVRITPHHGAVFPAIVRCRRRGTHPPLLGSTVCVQGLI